MAALGWAPEMDERLGVRVGSSTQPSEGGARLTWGALPEHRGLRSLWAVRWVPWLVDSAPRPRWGAPCGPTWEHCRSEARTQEGQAAFQILSLEEDWG